MYIHIYIHLYQRAASSEARRSEEGDDDCRIPRASDTAPSSSVRPPPPRHPSPRCSMDACHSRFKKNYFAEL